MDSTWDSCTAKKEMRWKEGEDMTERDAKDLVDWLDQAEDPVRADICYAGQRYLSMNLTNFRTEPKEGA